MPERIAKLEAALRFWEDYFLVMQGQNCVTPEYDWKEFQRLAHDGPAKHSGSFRKYLLGYRSGPFDFEKFTIGYDSEGAMLAGTMDFLPYALAMWTSKSRRVYHLSHDLQTLLMNTSMDDLYLKDVSWPFDAFAITLDTPILDIEGNETDCFLVSPLQYPMMSTSFQMGDRLQMQMTFNNYVNETLLNRSQRKLFRKLISQQKFDELRPLVVDAVQKRTAMKSRSVNMMAMIVDRENGGSSVMELASSTGREYTRVNRADVRESTEDMNDSIRLIAGLCMYLRSLPSNSPHVVREKKVSKRVRSKDRTAITDGADVCIVSSVYSLSADEKSVSEGLAGRTGAEVRVHWRQGHWRRPPGQGLNPKAAKTVWVRPTLVRRDRLPLGSLPGGTKQIA